MRELDARELRFLRELDAIGRFWFLLARRELEAIAYAEHQKYD